MKVNENVYCLWLKQVSYTPANLQTTAEIVIHPELQTEVEADSTVVLTCAAVGRPLPLIHWTRNGTTLVDNTTVMYQKLVTEGGITFVRSFLQTCATNSNNFSCIANNTVSIGEFNFGFDLNLGGE